MLKNTNPQLGLPSKWGQSTHTSVVSPERSQVEYRRETGSSSGSTTYRKAGAICGQGEGDCEKASKERHKPRDKGGERY